MSSGVVSKVASGAIGAGHIVQLSRVYAARSPNQDYIENRGA